ncbi:phospholipase A [Marinobacter lacisalsi]|uniref:Phospholipase A1 n=1 Tax=Marinobacter lacisalsi TaxID=475979 RepID=A0ABV8QLS9_9GAMM
MKQRTLAALLLTTIGAGLPLTAMAQDQQAPTTEAESRNDIPELAEELEQEMDQSDENTSNGRAMEQEVEEYEARERLIGSLIGGFVPYQPTYILPYTYVDNPNQTPDSPRLGESTYDSRLQSEEAKYQISFRVPLLTGMLDDSTTLWFGYTQTSFWQVYDTEESAPFRETNYQPEVFVRQRLGWDLGPGQLTSASIGFTHQSNGQSEPRSRSWNRIKGSIAYTYDRWLFMVNPWYRLPENDRDDDNPDIEEYMGYADYIAVYKWNDDHVISTRLLNNLRTEDNKTSVELGYSFPLGETIKGYIQYYNGYGESLIDYNERTHRIGIGIMLNDWL